MSALLLYFVSYVFTVGLNSKNQSNMSPTKTVAFVYYLFCTREQKLCKIELQWLEHYWDYEIGSRQG